MQYRTATLSICFINVKMSIDVCLFTASASIICVFAKRLFHALRIERYSTLTLSFTRRSILHSWPLHIAVTMFFKHGQQKRCISETNIKCAPKKSIYASQISTNMLAVITLFYPEFYSFTRYDVYPYVAVFVISSLMDGWMGGWTD